MIKLLPVEEVNKLNRNTLMDALGIECIELGKDFVKAKMPVDHRTHQPMGLLHGGASAAMIEYLGSVGSLLIIDTEKQYPVGIEVNANHIGGIKTGHVIGTASIIHAGKKTHVWQVDITEEGTERMICTGRLTVMIVDKN